MYLSWALCPDISEGKFYWLNDKSVGAGLSEVCTIQNQITCPKTDECRLNKNIAGQSNYDPIPPVILGLCVLLDSCTADLVREQAEPGFKFV